ncbi:Uncharacterised protein [uncultured Ruminococcus sp.]|uniref:Uncharacterized protein n=1 Tax=Massiliimalia timonensis TaxID=1987501 RepID=A0A8J6PDQ6_9FIRM|nr:hypothetical protein [Massiliimalia timonensis]MBC8611303.1 hypothetical protein [Massiliimalia timonensis]SCH07236.1 Uncharacterised protein [uncultured Clostridium sp.]SCI03355.1 Uncharacterised protein [uncultured Ruminococcus sp.]
MKYLGSVILIYAFVTLSGLLCTGLILGSFYCKKKLSQMNEEKWEAYFHSVSEVSYLIRFWIFYGFSLAVFSVIGYFVFLAFGFSHAGALAVLTAGVGIARTAFRFQKNKRDLLQKLARLKNCS